MPPAAKSRRTAVILTALDVETSAVLRHLERTNEQTVGGTVFYLGTFGDWDIAVAECGAGNTSVAAIAERAIASFRPSIALFVGVAGGVKDVHIGDVVVADKLYGFEAGKDEETGFRPRPEVKNSAHDIEQRGRALPKSNKWHERLNSDLEHGSPKIFVGPIAGGEKVVASTRSTTTKFLRKYYSDAIAVEMEGKGFLEAVNINSLVLGGVVRGISDLLSGKIEADESGSQLLAADAASAAAFEILHTLVLSNHDRIHIQKSAKKVPDQFKKSKITRSSTRKQQGKVFIGAPTAGSFLEIPSTFSRATYFAHGEILAEIGTPKANLVQFSYLVAPHAYVRVIPMSALEESLSLPKLRENARRAPLLGKRRGCVVAINTYGPIAYTTEHSFRGSSAPLSCATQLFRNGELWAMSNMIIIQERNSYPDWLPLPILHAFVFEELFYETLHTAIAFQSEHMGLTFPCQVELGIINARGMHIGITTADIRGPTHADSAICRVILPNPEQENINFALLEFFNQVYDLSGYRRPAGLHGFPPGPPKP